MRSSMKGIAVWLLIVLIFFVLAAQVNQSGGIWKVFAYDCQVTGQTLHANWQWVNFACYIQQPDGNWTRVDTNQNVRP